MEPESQEVLTWNVELLNGIDDGSLSKQALSNGDQVGRELRQSHTWNNWNGAQRLEHWNILSLLS